MSKLTEEQIANIKKVSARLEASLEELQGKITDIRNGTDYPDYNELIKDSELGDSKARAGYIIENIEVCLANIDNEVSDAFNQIERLKKFLK
jgi:peptidoglycan hydrolase CwlO-like protein